VDWDAFGRDMILSHIALIDISKEIYTTTGALGYMTSAVQNASVLVAAINDVRPSKFRINAPIHDEAYAKAIIEVHRAIITGMHIFFEEAQIDWLKRHNIRVTSTNTQYLSDAVSRVFRKTEKAIEWKNFMRGFTRLRNALSHSQPILKPYAIKDLKLARMEDWIDESQSMVRANFLWYPPLFRRIIDLFRDLDAAYQPSPP
jgi:hypothetical protein